MMLEIRAAALGAAVAVGLLIGQASLANTYKDSDGSGGFPGYPVPGCVEDFPQANCGGEPTAVPDSCDGNTLTEQWAQNRPQDPNCGVGVCCPTHLTSTFDCSTWNCPAGQNGACITSRPRVCLGTMGVRMGFCGCVPAGMACGPGEIIGEADIAGAEGGDDLELGSIGGDDYGPFVCIPQVIIEGNGVL